MMLFRTFTAIIARDLLLALRRPADIAAVLVFFVIVVTVFALGIGPEANLLRSIAPGVLWAAALLASLLALGRVFAADHADGTLEQMLMSPEPLSIIVLGKVAAHWITTGLPLVALGPLLALAFDLETTAIAVLAAALALGTPVLSLIGAIAAALTLGTRGAGVLTALLVLPLYVPVLVLGAGAVDLAAGGLDPSAHLMLLAGLFLIALTLALWPIAAALRIAVE